MEILQLVRLKIISQALDHFSCKCLSPYTIFSGHGIIIMYSEVKYSEGDYGLIPIAKKQFWLKHMYICKNYFLLLKY